jgi:thioredoxin reductase (NADPH)
VSIETTNLAETSGKGIFAAEDCKEGAIAHVTAVTGEGISDLWIQKFLKKK